MARTVTLATLRQKAQQRADMENSTFLSASEWNGLISDSASELYDILVTVYEDYFQSSYAFTTASGTSSYPLPADFYKLLGLDQQAGTNQSVTCEPFEFAERNHYQLYNAAGTQFTLYYIPACPVLASDSDTFDGVNGWDEYIVIDAAIKAKVKEESDISELMAAKSAIMKRIEDSAPNRDAGMGGRVVDVHRIDPYYGLISPAPARYRILGGNIQLRSMLTPLVGGFV
jgi:hypothetical protein